MTTDRCTSANASTHALVTVVVPSCDRPALLPRAVDSVLAQTVKPTELVVVDVGGRSWSDEAAAAVGRDTGITVSRFAVPAATPAGAARNIGCARSLLPVIAFLDDDDQWDSAYLEQALDLMRRRDLECVVTPIRIRKGQAVVRMPTIREGVISGDAVLTGSWNVTGSNLVIRRTAFDDLGGYDERLRALDDHEFLIRLLDRGTRYGVTSESNIEQLIHDGPQLTRASEQRLEALEQFAAKYFMRMSLTQQIHTIRERHRILARLAPKRRARVGHRTVDIVLTRPSKLLQRARRRSALHGGYD